MPRGVLGFDVFTTAVPGAARQAPDLGTIITITVLATATAGNVSATVRLEGSNDGANWHAVGVDVVIASAASPQIANATRVQFAYAQYRANVTAIAGTGAVVTTHIAVGA